MGRYSRKRAEGKTATETETEATEASKGTLINCEDTQKANVRVLACWLFGCSQQYHLISLNFVLPVNKQNKLKQQ